MRDKLVVGWVYGRFARCPVRPESFRPDPESFRPEYEVVSPGLRVDSPDINYALYLSKGAFLTDCNQTRDVL